MYVKWVVELQDEKCASVLSLFCVHCLGAFEKFAKSEC